MAANTNSGEISKEQTHSYKWPYHQSWISSPYQNFRSFVFYGGFSTNWELKSTYLNFSFNFHWKLIQLPNPKVRLNCVVWITLLLKNGTPYRTLKLEQILEPENGYMGVPQEDFMNSYLIGSRSRLPLVDSSGNLHFQIQLELTQLNRLPEKRFDEYVAKFHETSRSSMSALLNDPDTSDLIIVTCDGQEFLAHKLILKARCPVFATMFRSSFKERKTGKLEVKDIGSKVMGILLEYFYTGNLLPSWNDEDTVLEFTYAVGKYGINEILEMLNDVLGTNYHDNVTHQTVLLLDLVQKLFLKVAETTLLERVSEKIGEVTTTEELIELFGFSDINEVHKTENVTMTEFQKVMNLLDNALGEKFDWETSYFDISLLRLSREMCLTNVEIKLLEWLKKKAKKCKTANELFAFFQFGNSK